MMAFPVVDWNRRVIGIPLQDCFICGKPGTRHHVIPKALKPMRNLTIPLCMEHKDVCHPVVKQTYIPHDLRSRIGKILVNMNRAEIGVRALRKSFIENKTHTSSIELSDSSLNRKPNRWVIPEGGHNAPMKKRNNGGNHLSK